MAKNRVIVKKSLSDDFKRRLKSSRVVIGLPRDSAPYPDGTSVIQVGVDHEFGSETARTYTSPRGNTITVSGVPERSFMRSTAKDKRKEWTELVKKNISMIIKKEGDVKSVLSRIGLVAASDVKKKIVEINDPPNSPQVVEDKGSSNPLIDTGHLVGQITHEVRA